MDNIKVLEDIGLYKVSQETHIEQRYIKYMIDGEFDKLNRINTLGFVKILSREYNLDLSEWVEAFEEYWVQNRANPEEDEKLFIVMETGNKSKKYFIVFIIIVFAVVAGVAYSLFTQKSVIPKEYTSALSYNDTPIIEDTKSEIEKLEQDVQVQDVEQAVAQEESPVEAVVENNDTVQVHEVQGELNNTVLNENASQKTVQEVVREKVEDNVSVAEIPKIEKVSEVFDNQIIMIPKSELWIGVIYMDTFKRRSFLGEGNFSIDRSRNQIITTGHGSFSIQSEGVKLDYNRQTPIRFQVKNGEMQEISWSKFKELNRGNPW